MGTREGIAFGASILAGMAGGGMAAVVVPALYFSSPHLYGPNFATAFNRCALGAVLGAVPGIALGLSAWWACARLSDQARGLTVQIAAAILAFFGAAALAGWAMIQLLLWALVSA